MREKVDSSSVAGGKRKVQKGPEGDGAPDDTELEDAFALMDMQKRGEVDFEEFKAGMSQAGMVPELCTIHPKAYTLRPKA
jgi:hypothetical protein